VAARRTVGGLLLVAVSLRGAPTSEAGPPDVPAPASPVRSEPASKGDAAESPAAWLPFGLRSQDVDPAQRSKTTHERALSWLAAQQGRDGRWRGGDASETRAEYDNGATALATLAFLGAGYTHLSEGRWGDVVDRAIVAPQARDTSAATRLWQTCEDLTGVKFLFSASSVTR